MKLSVFTPSHDTTYLEEAYWSLCGQTYENWEWVVLLNGAAVEDKPAFWKDSRVRIVRTRDKMGIGALKYEACRRATGDVLVELDHDDYLSAFCLGAVADAFADNPDAGLVYCDTIQVNPDRTPNLITFNPMHGWRYRKEGDYLVPFTAEPFPQNVTNIWYAPNHVRAYRRTVYEAVGGHDIEFGVCDDQDLCLRMYLAAPFVHIREPFYFQRIHKGNSQTDPEKNRTIQEMNGLLYERDVQAVALEWARREGFKCYDLGCGPDGPAPGYRGIDLHDYGRDNVCVGDVFDVLGCVNDRSVGVLRAVDFLEHMPPDRVVELMNLMWRKLAHGGMLLSLTPSTDGRGAYCDPTHISWWNEMSFGYYTRADKARFVPEIECRFMASKVCTYQRDFGEDGLLPYVQANLVALHDGPTQFGVQRW